MPNPPFKKRTYGYIDTTGERDPETPTPSRQHRQSSGFWRKALRFPFVLVWCILRLPFRFFSMIWRSSPSLSRKAKEGLRRKMFMVGVSGAVICLLGGTLFVAWVSRGLPDPDRLTDRQVAQSTKIYDRTGEHVLYEIFSQQKRTLVQLDEIPKDLINGLVATEDKLFYEHMGVRPLSILRAFLVGTFTNKRIAGTSTLTQQLIKNAILTNERNGLAGLIRKSREIILSIRLEQKYTKDQILKIYFNEIPYGSTNYGVESASQSYFGKHVSDLTLAESATLAGFPKAPSKYLNDPEALKTRRNFVLARMYEEGYITKEQKEAAQAEPLELKPNITNIKAPHFVMYVKEQLVDHYGEQTVERGGLRVITTLDWEKQEAAEAAVNDYTKVLEEAGGNNAALVATDPETGQILAMVGSRDFFDDSINGQFNVTTLGKRQPGSSFKPIIYAAAFEKGYTPDTVLFDVLTDFDASDKEYMPKNYDLGERGPTTIRYALQGSLNIPAVQTLYLVGPKKGVEFAERMGYTTLSTGNFGLSLVLGGGEVKLLEHVAAYGIFANNGVRQETTSILKVETPDGEILSEWRPKQGERVISQEIAAITSNVLSDDAARAYVFGAGGVLTLPDRPVAAKTGTTNDYIDAWTIGYTPSLAAGVWAGNTDNSKMKQGYGGSRVAGQIWNAFMKKALAKSPVETFPTPPPNDATKPVLRGSHGGSITLMVDKVTGKIATSSTPPNYIEERTYTQAHSILHYVDKDDPRGPFPTDPSLDPQYTIWESAIQDWIRRRKEKEPEWNVHFEDPPTEYDDAHTLALLPTVEILSPTEGTLLPSRNLLTDIRVSAPRGVTLVRYRIDGQLVDTVRAHPFNLHADLTNLASGVHTLTVEAEDDMGNMSQQTVRFSL